MVSRIELLSNETVNGCLLDRFGWEEKSEVKFGHVESEVIIHPSKEFSRNMECMGLEIGREIMWKIYICCEILITSTHGKAK